MTLLKILGWVSVFLFFIWVIVKKISLPKTNGEISYEKSPFTWWFIIVSLIAMQIIMMYQSFR